MGLGSVVGAYFDDFEGRGNPVAPLSPWFWQDQPQTAGWVKVDDPNTVFARQTLRVWLSRYRTSSGLALFVATIGHERLLPHHLIPVQEPVFDSVRAGLSQQLLTLGLAKRDQSVAFPSLLTRQSPTLGYEGLVSVITLAQCR